MQYKSEEEAICVSEVQKSGKEGFVEYDNNYSIRFYIERKNIGFQDEIEQDERLDNILHYMNDLGYHNFYVFGIGRTQSGDLTRKIARALHTYQIRINAGSRHWISANFFKRLYMAFSKIDYSDLYINAVRSLIRYYQNIAVIMDSPLALKLYHDLKISGKAITPIKLGCKNKILKKVNLRKRYDIIVTTDFSNEEMEPRYGNTDLFHMSFYDFFNSGRGVLPHDKDIPINILPWLKENSIDLYVVEEPTRYEMKCNFTESIVRMKDIVVHSGYRDRFLEDVSIEAIEECSRLTIRDGYIDFYDFEMPGYTWKGGERHTEGSKYDRRYGAIVMNCNPFTNGHMYLIEKARKSCDGLYLFVVEEDKSFFKFDDRIKMVKRAIQGMKGITVIPSGNFMISSDTLPGYFYKEDLQDTILDASYDLQIFCEAIAPLFHISVRFAGEEPEDRFTEQYNEQMAEILPRYGLRFITFPRVEHENKPISGTKVRELYKSKSWSELKEYVPESVLNYLKEMQQGLCVTSSGVNQTI